MTISQCIARTSTFRNLLQLQGREQQWPPNVLKEHAFVSSDVQHLTGGLGLTLEKLVEHLRVSDRDEQKLLWMGTGCYQGCRALRSTSYVALLFALRSAIA